MSSIFGFLAPPLVGGLIGVLAMFGVVASQTGAPSDNPAKQAAISYGQ
jgi:hypothetical protein